MFVYPAEAEPVLGVPPPAAQHDGVDGGGTVCWLLQQNFILYKVDDLEGKERQQALEMLRMMLLPSWLT